MGLPIRRRYKPPPARPLLYNALLVLLSSRPAMAQPLSPLADYSAEQLIQAVKHPNASAKVLVPDPSGFNLLEPWPGATGPVAGWQFAIDIKSDVPVTDTELYTTLTRIAYEPPDTVTNVLRNASGDFVPMDGSWYPCMRLWVSNVLKSGEDKDDVDADCSSHLSGKCLRDLKKSIASGFVSWTDKEATEHCPRVGIPDSCIEQMGEIAEDSETQIVETVDELNHTPLDYLPLQRLFYDDKLPHDMEDNTDYLLALRRVWVVGIGWGFSNNSEFARSTEDAQEHLTLNTSLACIRAKSISPLPENDPEGILDHLDDGPRSVELPVAWWSCITFLMAVAFAWGL